MPGLRVLLDIVFDPDGRQCPLKAIGCPRLMLDPPRE